MNLKVLLKGLSLTLFPILANANECDDIRTYFNGIDSKYMYSKCSVDDNGKVNTFWIDNNCTPNEIFNNIYNHYVSIKTMQLSLYNIADCFEGFPTSMANLKNLEDLTINCSENITFDLSVITKLPIKSLYFTSCTLTQSNIEQIASIETLESLKLYISNVKNLNFDLLKKHQKLTTLISSHSLEGEDLDGFNNIKSLEFYPLDNNAIQHIVNLTNLNDLNRELPISSDIDLSLKNKLNSISINVDFVGNNALKGYNNLKRLYIMGNISHTVIENVATLNNLEELNIFNTENNLMNLNPLKNLGQLSSLEIKCPSVRYRNELFSVETNSFIVLKKIKKTYHYRI